MTIVEKLNRVAANGVYLMGVPGTIPGNELAKEALDYITELESVIFEAFDCLGDTEDMRRILGKIAAR